MGTSSERVFNGSGKGYLSAGAIGNRTHILSERLKAGTEFIRLKKGHRPAPMPPTWTHICPISLSQQIACTKNMATRKGWPCRFYLQEIFCVRGVLSRIQSCAPSRFHTLARSCFHAFMRPRFPHSRVRAFVLVYSPVRITTCGNPSGGTEQRLERANSCRRQR